jgi:hypothetical protein
VLMILGWSVRARANRRRQGHRLRSGDRAPPRRAEVGLPTDVTPLEITTVVGRIGTPKPWGGNSPSGVGCTMNLM